jgi:SnoaL-like domain
MESWELVARECCRDTLARYTHAGDRYRIEELGSTFCEDGVLEIRGVEPIMGRAAIVATFSGDTSGLQAQMEAAIVEPKESAAPPPSPDAGANAGAKYILRHNVTNIRFESVSPTETTVASYFLVVTRKGLDHVGRYRDRMVPVGEQWLIAHRFVSVDWRAPDTLP